MAGWLAGLLTDWMGDKADLAAMVIGRLRRNYVHDDGRLIAHDRVRAGEGYPADE